MDNKTGENSNRLVNADSDEIGDLTFHQYGFLSAQKSVSNPKTIEIFLNNIYSRTLNRQFSNDTEPERHISGLESEILQKKKQKNAINAELEHNKRHKKDKKNEIKELEREKKRLKSISEPACTISFTAWSSITALLTVYLFIVYFSLSYFTFYGVKTNTWELLNLSIFADAYTKTSGVTLLIVLFLIVFFWLGFLISDAIEEIKKEEARWRKISTVLVTLTLLLVVLSINIFLVYRSLKNTYLYDFNTLATAKDLDITVIYTNHNFYRILALGFVPFLIWSFLLNFVFSHPYLREKNGETAPQLEKINSTIAKEKKELAEIDSKINLLLGDVTNLSNEIDRKEQDITSYKSGIPGSLKTSVEEFMSGYQEYVNDSFEIQNAKKLIHEAKQVQENWLKIKIGGKTPENTAKSHKTSM